MRVRFESVGAASGDYWLNRARLLIRAWSLRRVWPLVPSPIDFAYGLRGLSVVFRGLYLEITKIPKVLIVDTHT